jgi:dihydropteroate synthase
MTPAEPILLRGRPLLPGSGPFVFGILNCTPDSFSDGGLYANPADAIQAGCRMADEGAAAIDIGGESTRPGSQPVPPDEQIRRTQAVIAGLAGRFGRDGPAISIDTQSAQAAEAALDAGATIVNDISALRSDPALAGLVARRGAGLILMHMKGTPADMQRGPVYADVVAEVAAFLEERVRFALAAGIPREHLIVDPGIGFGKTMYHNLKLLGRLDALHALGLPVMIGPSRKRFIREVLKLEQGESRLIGTAAIVAACVLAGVECIRVHDVAACRQAALIAKAIGKEKSE